ncbi:hypothetical protein GQ43DRAFT_357671, partial [Delitschia confertaspora ATCC 74209]
SCSSTLAGHSGTVCIVVSSPYRQLVASASENTTVRLWEAAAGTCRSTLKHQYTTVTSLAFAPDNQ